MATSCWCDTLGTVTEGILGDWNALMITRSPINHLMKSIYIYFGVIALLLYVTYARHHDENRQKQQEAQIHREFCALVDSHPNCKK